MNSEMNNLLNSIKRDMWAVIGGLNAGDSQGAKELAAGVCTKIADYQAAIRMAEEVANPNRYALAGLTAPNYAHDGEDGDEGEGV